LALHLLGNSRQDLTCLDVEEVVAEVGGAVSEAAQDGVAVVAVACGGAGVL
jgi:hypothetical protein